MTGERKTRLACPVNVLSLMSEDGKQWRRMTVRQAGHIDGMYRNSKRRKGKAQCDLPLFTRARANSRVWKVLPLSYGMTRREARECRCNAPAL
jgi:hypothetical protein